ncbi:MAG: Amidohydrolase [Candidatus Magnetoglobus multicellularis str. Araruama]|uniref:Amidohydrolase n=1 Tax=Candidatus Magnetoglobus multicellularis str. Araruama TaxID=890399 RepID=A0A1V1PI18_9BACT|nr:MAG: Amidohydrolase [Candidatus Magnetoglobus multicellularis str. Araruama]
MYKTYRAKWAMIDPEIWVQNASLTIDPMGTIIHCGSSSNPSAIDLGDGVMMPALINAHTHLELSALRNQLPMNMGFTSWVQHLIETRACTPTETLIQGAQDACEKLWKLGTCAVGEISSLGLTQNIFFNSGLYGCWFQEYLGNEILPLNTHLSDPQSNCFISLAGHAPHTTSPNLLKHLKQASTNKPFSIHVAESDVEMTFITQASGNWADFLTSRGVDYSQWGLPQLSPVRHLERIGLLDHNTLLVHLLNIDKHDLTIVKKHHCPVCICPRSNVNLHQRLPNVNQMIDSGLTVCLGTDSLASVASLSIWDEMKYLATHCPNISPTQILAMATTSGARALGIDNQLGRLAAGYNSAFLFVPVDGNSPETIASQLVYGGGGDGQSPSITR